MASPRRILHTTPNFDDAITQHALLVINLIRNESRPARIHTVYLYQDFTSSETLYPKKNVIVISRYCRDDLAGFAEPSHRRHFIRSRVYRQMASERTLRYFNKIRLQS